MTAAELADERAAGASDVLAVQLFRRRYERTMGLLAREFPHDRDELHDAMIDALQEIRRAGRYTSYSRQAEYLWIDLSRKRMLDRVRRRTRRQRIAPIVALDEARDQDAGDAVGEALAASGGNARLRELVAPMRKREAQFWFLRWHQGLETAEICERMQISPVAARKLITSCAKRMRAFYEAVEDGSVHAEFEVLLRARLAGDATFDALADPVLAAHLGWCDRCGRLLDQAERDMRAIVPLLPAIAAGAAKGGLLGGLFGGGSAAGGGGSLLGGLTAGKAVVVACSVGCVAAGGVAVVEATHPATVPAVHAHAKRQHPRSRSQSASGSTAAVATTTGRAVGRAPVATGSSHTTASRASTSRRAKRRDVEQFAGLARAARSTGGASATPQASATPASSSQVEQGYGLKPAARRTTSTTSTASSSGSRASGNDNQCTPGDLGC